MLEYVNYCGKYYGTPKSEVDARPTGARPLCWSLRVVGAANIKSFIRKARSFFIMPPSMDELRPPGGRGQRERRGDCRPGGQRKNCPMPESMIFSVENRDVDACADEIYRIF